MKYLFLLLTTVFVGCGVNTSGKINVDPEDIKIIRKGNVCFGIVASRKTGSLSTTGLGLAHVPCEKVGY